MLYKCTGTSAKVVNTNEVIKNDIIKSKFNT